MKRREFLLTPLALSLRANAQFVPPRIAIVELAANFPPPDPPSPEDEAQPEIVLPGGLTRADVTPRRTAVEALSETAISFPRAYAACPDAAFSGDVLRRGRYPHVFGPADPALTQLLEPFSGNVDPSAAPPANTITVFTRSSADGDDSAFDRSLHVPLAIAWPGRLTPRAAPEILISHLDVMPTVLGLAGVTIPQGVQGRDLSRLAGGGGQREELPDSVYAQGRLGTVDEWRAVVRGYDKIVIDAREQVTGLYNLALDPQESNNLAEPVNLGERVPPRSPEQAARNRLLRDSMLALFRQWMRRMQDGMDPSGLRLRRVEDR